MLLTVDRSVVQYIRLIRKDEREGPLHGWRDKQTTRRWYCCTRFTKQLEQLDSQECSMVLLYTIHYKQLEQLDSRCGSIIANHTPLSFLIQCLFLV